MEFAAAQRCGVRLVSLGARTLRADAVAVRERVSDAFWIVPSAFLAGGIGLAFLIRALDDVADVRPGSGPWWVGTPSGASSVLATVATSILTFLGVVFSITLVALQLASQQFSPRVTRTFVRSTTTKVALGIFIATLVCSLLALAAVERGPASQASAPVVSVSVVLLLVGASLVVFVAFVNNTTRLIRIAHIIGAVEENYPPASAYVLVAPPPPGDPRRTWSRR